MISVKRGFIILIILAAIGFLFSVPVSTVGAQEGVPTLPEGGDIDENNAPIIDVGQTYNLPLGGPNGYHLINVPEEGSVVVIDYSEGTRVNIGPYVSDRDAFDPVGTFDTGYREGEPTPIDPGGFVENHEIKFVSVDEGLQPIDMHESDYLTASDENPPVGHVTIRTIPPEPDIFTVESITAVPQDANLGESITIQATVSYNRDDVVNPEDGNLEFVINGDIVGSETISPSLDSTTTVSTTYELDDVDTGGGIPITVQAAPEWKETNKGSSEQTTITVDTPPSAVIDCSPNSIIEGESVTCDGLDSSDENGITTYDWNFGDGNSDSGSSVTHTYDTPGTYTIELTVTDDSGQTSTVKKTVTVEEAVPPSAVIDCSSNSITAGESVSCSASDSTDEDTAIESYEWHFGDEAESTATGSSAEYTFEDPGSYTVELEVTDSTGLTDTTTTTIEAAARIPPSAEISCSPDSVFTGETISCSAGESSDEDGTIQSYSWDFEGGGTPTGNEPSVQYRYDAPGTYTVEVTVTDNTGETGSDTTTVTVEQNQAPRANFEIGTENPTVNERITFDASASTDDNGIATYSWDLGNGDEATGSVIEQDYEQPGEYTVTLETIDQVGNSDIEKQTVFVSPMFTGLSIRSIPESANDPAQLTFSTTNQLGSRPAKVQLFISTPDEVTITDYNLPPDWSTGKSATIVSNEPLQPGESEDMQMDIVATANGSYSIDGEVIYLIGNEEEKVGPISTAPVEMAVGTQSTGGSTSDSNPGFGFFVAITAISLTVAILRRK